MKKTILWIAGLVALAVLIAGAYVLYDLLGDKYSPGGTVPGASEPGVSEESTTGDTTDYSAPDFTVYDWNGNPVTLSDLKGRPIVLNFWASWCPPCKAEMPDFEEMYLKYGDQVVFMMVNITDEMQETEAAAKAHIEDCGYTFPVYFDKDMDAAYTYYVSSLPQTFFIDKNGDLFTYYISMLSGAKLEQYIQMILD